MSLNNFIKTIDGELHKQYTMEKFKEGHTGKNFVVEEPKFEFKKPIFKNPRSILPKASEIPAAKEYLENRKLNPDKFYFAESLKSGLTLRNKLSIMLSMTINESSFLYMMSKRTYWDFRAEH